MGLHSNELEGPISAGLGSLVSLEWLYLSWNNLTGPIPQAFLQLDRLRVLYIGANEGLCVPGTSAFVAWLEGIERRDESGALCNERDWKVAGVISSERRVRRECRWVGQRPSRGRCMGPGRLAGSRDGT